MEKPMATRITAFLLAGIFIGTSAFAGDYDLTLEMLQNATDPSKITWTKESNEPPLPPEGNVGDDTYMTLGQGDISASTGSGPLHFSYTYLPAQADDAESTIYKHQGIQFSDIAEGKIAFAESTLSNYDDNSNTNLNFDFIGSPIYNSENIGNITGDFIGYVPGDYRTINNEYRGDQDNVSIGDITGNFIGTRGIYNFIDGNTAYDGSTYNLSIGNITSSLIYAWLTNSQQKSLPIGRLFY